jgi:VanZ family protein
LRRLARTTGWILLLAIAALSFVPPPLRPITCLPHIAEHAAIYSLAGCAVGLGYPNRFLKWLAGLGTFTLAIEIVQLWIPGRHARWLDFLVDVFSISVGLGIGVMLARGSTGSS